MYIDNINRYCSRFLLPVSKLPAVLDLIRHKLSTTWCGSKWVLPRGEGRGVGGCPFLGYDLHIVI